MPDLSSQSPPPRPPRPIPLRLAAGLVVGLAAVLIIVALGHPQSTPSLIGEIIEALTGANPRPVRLVRPATAPLSALALLGRQIFYDPSLSASGQQSCASCHSPSHGYGPPNGLPVQLGGSNLTLAGVRPPPSLAYLYRQTPFTIGPEAGETDTPPSLSQTAAQAKAAPRAQKVAGDQPAAPALTPQGGLFWDGRSDTLQLQAGGPLLNPAEMANTSLAEVAAKLARAPYSAQFKPLFGPDILSRPSLLVAEAMSALARYQIEDRSFHAFDSKYDAWLEGKARLAPDELRGMRLFNDPARANCGGCHLSQPTPDGLPPLFTDTQYEALGLPRNPAIPANRDPHFYDLGLCGPIRRDLTAQTQYCGMFLTPTLRNAAERRVFFHNGVYHTLGQAIRFYNLRQTDPGAIYPTDASGRVETYDDLPAAYRSDVDVADAPFNRKPGDRAPMTDRDITDLIAFIKTLDDGYSHHPG